MKATYCNFPQSFSLFSQKIRGREKGGRICHFPILAVFSFLFLSFSQPAAGVEGSLSIPPLPKIVYPREFPQKKENRKGRSKATSTSFFPVFEKGWFLRRPSVVVSYGGHPLCACVGGGGGEGEGVTSFFLPFLFLSECPVAAKGRK